MISTKDLIIMIIVAVVYLFILPFQLILFPMKYYSVKDVIYSGNPKKATGALLTRFLFIFLICCVLWLFNKRDNIGIWGIGIGSFLCTWPSIYHYQLFACFRNKYKALYLLACFVSIAFSWACAYFAMKILLPVIYEGKNFFLIDNSGIQLLYTIIGLVMPIGMRKILKEDEQDNPYLVSDTKYADIYLTKRKMDFNSPFFDHFRYEIDEAANKNNVSPALLRTVLQLERINRGTWFNRIGERLAVRFIPHILISRNATLGLGQVSIKKAHGYFHRAPERYIREMLKPEIGIELCAYVLKDIIIDYEEFSPSADDPLADLFEDRYLSVDYKISVFVASHYICGDNNALKKYILIYADIIHEQCPSFYPENG